MREFLATTRDWLVTCALTCLTVGASIVLAMLLGVTDGFPHEAPSGWSYPGYCCSGRDCNRIPHDQVSIGPEGYRVTLKPGDHDFVTHETSWLIPFDKAKKSGDQEDHICIDQSMKMLCFFAAPRGF